MIAVAKTTFLHHQMPFGYFPIAHINGDSALELTRHSAGRQAEPIRQPWIEMMLEGFFDSFASFAPMHAWLAGLGVAWLLPVLLFAIVGFIAQLVDGAMGMAYGITSSTLLLSLGVPPQAISASVHSAEVFTTGASGISHYLTGNVDAKLMWNLAIPGVAGGLLGALLHSQLQVSWILPLVSLYLLAVGGLILYRAFVFSSPSQNLTGTKRLGLIAGFLDAVGGGGWGTLTSGSLISRNLEPRIAIASANAAEFFVTVTIAIALIRTLDLSHLSWLVGLVIGGIIAAPIAARLVNYIPRRAAMWSVGTLVCLLSTFNLGRLL
jgi:uncharacterized protein